MEANNIQNINLYRYFTATLKKFTDYHIDFLQNLIDNDYQFHYLKNW